MSTLATITESIDDNIRNKTPKVLKVEHADTEQLIAEEHFPDAVKVEWNGATSVDPITDIVVDPGIPVGTGGEAGTMAFTINFWKSGNDVFFSGKIRNISSGSVNTTRMIINFPTSLYKPLSISTMYAEMTFETAGVVPTTKLKVNSAGMQVFGNLNASSFFSYFHGNYKVAN